MHRGFYNTITYPYSVPRLERLLRMFGQNFGKFLGMEVFKALSDFSAFIQHAAKKMSSIFSPIMDSPELPCQGRPSPSGSRFRPLGTGTVDGAPFGRNRRNPPPGLMPSNASGQGFAWRGGGGIGAVPEHLQSGRRGCESGWGGGGAVSGSWKCVWGWCWGMGMLVG